MHLYDFDRQYLKHDYSLVGVDEAGRGPLAGPVVAAAVCLDYEHPICGLNDSKKLSAKKRESLYEQIITSARAYQIVQIPVSYIDEHNILRAALKAMSDAIVALELSNPFCLIDGNHKPSANMENVLTIIKGDAKSAAIAAASILAKVWRDRLMQDLDAVYPQYGFALHKGYGTPAHLRALDAYGICPQHRQSFEPIRQRTIWNTLA